MRWVAVGVESLMVTGFGGYVGGFLFGFVCMYGDL